MGLFRALTVLLVGSVVLSLITTHKEKIKAIPIIGDYATEIQKRLTPEKMGGGAESRLTSGDLY